MNIALYENNIFYVLQNPPEVHANAAETLCAITRNAPSPLATKLSSPGSVQLCQDVFLVCGTSLGK